MGRRSWAFAMLAALAAIALVASLAAADTGTFGAPQAGQTAMSSDPSDLAQEVEIMMTVRELQLTPEQISGALALAQRVEQQRQAVEELREQTWQEHQDAFEAVIEAWMAGNEAPSGPQRVANRAVEEVRSAEQQLSSARISAAQQFVSSLSENQRAMVETQQAAAEREARRQRLGGMESVGAFVAAELDAIRDLMPDEYQMLAEAEAQRMAWAIVGADSPNFDAVAATLLNIMDQVRAWTSQQYQSQRPRIPQMVENALGMSPAAQRPVRWDEVVQVVGSQRSVAVLQELSAAGGGEAQ